MQRHARHRPAGAQKRAAAPHHDGRAQGPARCSCRASSSSTAPTSASASPSAASYSPSSWPSRSPSTNRRARRRVALYLPWVPANIQRVSFSAGSPRVRNTLAQPRLCDVAPHGGWSVEEGRSVVGLWGAAQPLPGRLPTPWRAQGQPSRVEQRQEREEKGGRGTKRPLHSRTSKTSTRDVSTLPPAVLETR